MGSYFNFSQEKRPAKNENLQKAGKTSLNEFFNENLTKESSQKAESYKKVEKLIFKVSNENANRKREQPKTREFHKKAGKVVLSRF